MEKTNIIDFTKRLGFDYKQYCEEVVRIGDKTALRVFKGAKYRRNYERALLLMSIIQSLDVKKFLEFGTGRGFVTACALLVKPTLKISTIDHKYSAQAKELLIELGMDISNISFIYSDSEKLLAKDIGLDFDLVFIDGGHEYDSVKNDFGLARKCCSSGVIVFDDFRNKHSGVKKFIKMLDVPKILVNSHGWVWKNKMIAKTRDADGISDNREYKSGQVVVDINGLLKDFKYG